MNQQKTKPNFLSTLTRKIQVTENLRKKALKYGKGELGYLGMDNIPKKPAYLVPSLPLVEDVLDDKNPTESICYQLKQRASSTGTATASTTYKFYVKRFNEGTVHQWITTRHALQEIWTQNNNTEGNDRVATVRALLRGESLTVFNASMEELENPTDAQGIRTQQTVTADMVDTAMGMVAKTVFPHRALMTQKVWMRRAMRKPKELSFRKTAAAVGRLNNSLPLFPNGSDADKFSDAEVVELLEWSIPQTWRTKFDLDGYVPTEGTKAQLITACEILERNDPQKQAKGLNDRPKDKAHKKGQSSKYKNDRKSPDKKAGFYCTEHGANPTHDTAACYTLKNRANKGKETTTLNKKSFRRELNNLTRKTPKKVMREIFTAVLAKERGKSSKQKRANAASKKRKGAVTASSSSESSSDDEKSINVMDRNVSFEQKLKKQRENRTTRTKCTTKHDKQSNESTETPEEHSEEMELAKELANLGAPRDADADAN
mgnify:CR=1 FL=1